MASDTEVFAYRTEGFLRRVRWLLVCRDGRVDVYQVATITPESACCLALLALPFSILLAAVAAWLGEKAFDERKLNKAAIPVEKLALSDLPAALSETTHRESASASDLFLRQTKPAYGSFEIQTVDGDAFAHGRMVVGIDTALEVESEAEALGRLRDWLRGHGALVASDA